MKESAERSMLVQGSILAGAGIVTKLIGFLYRIPMANLLGNAGNGIYSVSFGIYNIALTLSSCSMPLAVSKLVSARVSRGKTASARRAFRDALALAILLGGIAALLLYFGADALEGLYHRPGLAKPLRILAPTTFVVALLGVLRGWFQGHGNMVPTAVSQVLEQLVNAVVSVVAAWQLTRIYISDPQVNAYGAAGGTLGTLAGAASALLFMAILLLRSRRRDFRRLDQPEPHSLILRQLLLTVIPVILSQTIYQIGYTLDDFLFGNLMILRGFTDAQISALQGVFNTQYNQLVNLPVAISTALAASAVPEIVAATVSGSRRGARRKITSVLKLSMAVSIPAAVGMAILARPIMHLLFTSLGEDEIIAVRLLQVGSSAAVFYALSTITTAILQASDYMAVPVVHCAVSLGIHVALVSILLCATPLSVYAMVIGNVTFPLLVSLLNCRSLRRTLGYHGDLSRILGIPLVSSAIMGLAVWAVNQLVELALPHGVSLLLSVALGIVLYAWMILRLHCFSDRQLLELPFGKKLLTLSCRLDRRELPV